MKKLAAVMLAVWVVRYDVYTGGGQVPCANAQAVVVSTSPTTVIQQPLCVSYSLIPRSWPGSFSKKKEADATAKALLSQGGVLNVRVEEVKR